MAENEQKPTPITGAFELFSKSSALVQQNLSTFAIVYLLPFLVNLAFIVRGLSSHDKNYTAFSSFSSVPSDAVGAYVGFGLVIGILVLVVWLVITALRYGLLLETSRTKKPGLDELWPYAKKYWWKLFVMNILIVIMTVIGFILLIVPGLIVIRRYFLAPYVLIDKDVGIWEAMKQSAAMTKPYSGYIWSIIGVSFLIGLPSVVPVVGWAVSFVLALLYSVAPALRYQELKKLA